MEGSPQRRHKRRQHPDMVRNSSARVVRANLELLIGVSITDFQAESFLTYHGLFGPSPSCTVERLIAVGNGQTAVLLTCALADAVKLQKTYGDGKKRYTHHGIPTTVSVTRLEVLRGPSPSDNARSALKRAQPKLAGSEEVDRHAAGMLVGAGVALEGMGKTLDALGEGVLDLFQGYRRALRQAGALGDDDDEDDGGSSSQPKHQPGQCPICDGAYAALKHHGPASPQAKGRDVLGTRQSKVSGGAYRKGGGMWGGEGGDNEEDGSGEGKWESKGVAGVVRAHAPGCPKGGSGHKGRDRHAKRRRVRTWDDDMGDLSALLMPSHRASAARGLISIMDGANAVTRAERHSSVTLNMPATWHTLSVALSYMQRSGKFRFLGRGLNNIRQVAATSQSRIRMRGTTKPARILRMWGSIVSRTLHARERSSLLFAHLCVAAVILMKGFMLPQDRRKPLPEPESNWYEAALRGCDDDDSSSDSKPSTASDSGDHDEHPISGFEEASPGAMATAAGETVAADLQPALDPKAAVIRAFRRRCGGHDSKRPQMPLHMLTAVFDEAGLVAPLNADVWRWAMTRDSMVRESSWFISLRDLEAFLDAFPLKPRPQTPAPVHIHKPSPSARGQKPGAARKVTQKGRVKRDQQRRHDEASASSASVPPVLTAELLTQGDQQSSSNAPTARSSSRSGDLYGLGPEPYDRSKHAMPTLHPGGRWLLEDFAQLDGAGGTADNGRGGGNGRQSHARGKEVTAGGDAGDDAGDGEKSSAALVAGAAAIARAVNASTQPQTSVPHGEVEAGGTAIRCRDDGGGGDGGEGSKRASAAGAAGVAMVRAATGSTEQEHSSVGCSGDGGGGRSSHEDADGSGGGEESTAAFFAGAGAMARATQASTHPHASASGSKVEMTGAQGGADGGKIREGGSSTSRNHSGGGGGYNGVRGGGGGGGGGGDGSAGGTNSTQQLHARDSTGQNAGRKLAVAAPASSNGAEGRGATAFGHAQHEGGGGVEVQIPSKGDATAISTPIPARAATRHAATPPTGVSGKGAKDPRPTGARAGVVEPSAHALGATEAQPPLASSAATPPQTTTTPTPQTPPSVPPSPSITTAANVHQAQQGSQSPNDGSTHMAEAMGPPPASLLLEPTPQTADAASVRHEAPGSSDVPHSKPAAPTVKRHTRRGSLAGHMGGGTRAGKKPGGPQEHLTTPSPEAGQGDAAATAQASSTPLAAPPEDFAPPLKSTTAQQPHFAEPQSQHTDPHTRRVQQPSSAAAQALSPSPSPAPVAPSSSATTLPPANTPPHTPPPVAPHTSAPMTTFTTPTQPQEGHTNLTHAPPASLPTSSAPTQPQGVPIVPEAPLTSARSDPPESARSDLSASTSQSTSSSSSSTASSSSTHSNAARRKMRRPADAPPLIQRPPDEEEEATQTPLPTVRKPFGGHTSSSLSPAPTQQPSASPAPLSASASAPSVHSTTASEHATQPHPAAENPTASTQLPPHTHTSTQPQPATHTQPASTVPSSARPHLRTEEGLRPPKKVERGGVTGVPMPLSSSSAITQRQDDEMKGAEEGIGGGGDAGGRRGGGGGSHADDGSGGRNGPSATAPSTSRNMASAKSPHAMDGSKAVSRPDATEPRSPAHSTGALHPHHTHSRTRGHDDATAGATEPFDTHANREGTGRGQGLMESPPAVRSGARDTASPQTSSASPSSAQPRRRLEAGQTDRPHHDASLPSRSSSRPVLEGPLHRLPAAGGDTSPRAEAKGGTRQTASGDVPLQVEEPGSKTVARAYTSNAAAPVRCPASTSRASDAGAKQNAKPVRGEAAQRISSLTIEAAEESDVKAQGTRGEQGHAREDGVRADSKSSRGPEVSGRDDRPGDASSKVSQAQSAKPEGPKLQVSSMARPKTEAKGGSTLQHDAKDSSRTGTKRVDEHEHESKRTSSSPSPSVHAMGKRGSVNFDVEVAAPKDSSTGRGGASIVGERSRHASGASAGRRPSVGEAEDKPWRRDRAQFGQAAPTKRPAHARSGSS